ncbi:helix-turn-helix transcriptional regulator [Amycolatopsis sp. NPDC005232]|uniref:helix-turn-helix transcriptional regulator n=1 Tax=Amycolatopsis sp. NPDC005232 TaxID=3157027 RepID=UPI0033BB564C
MWTRRTRWANSSAPGATWCARRSRGCPAGPVAASPDCAASEVAILAGISSDYYLRLEQGRDRNPSEQVLCALAGVLQLDGDATAHLLSLSRPTRRKSPPRRLPPGVDRLVDCVSGTPAYVQDKLTNVLAANPPATALSPNYRPGVNLLRAVFLDPAERALRRDWTEATAEGVATLRARVGPDVDDPRLRELVGELSVRSARFRQLWGRHDVRPRAGRVHRLTHPSIGEFELRSTKLTVDGTDAVTLVVFQAAPGSRSAELLGLLGSLAV